MKDITLTLNPTEASVLISIMDSITKAEGLKVAEASLHFIKKVQEAQLLAKKAVDLEEKGSISEEEAQAEEA